MNEIFLENLRKACLETAELGVDLLRKSQMGLDFATTPNPHANHKAYTRTNASGTVSQIKQAGMPHEEAPSVGKLHSGGKYRVEVEAGPAKGKDGVHADNCATHEDIRAFVKKHGKKGSEVRIWDTTKPMKAGIPHRTLTVGAEDADEQPVTVQIAKVDQGHAIPPNPALAKPLKKAKA